MLISFFVVKSTPILKDTFGDTVKRKVCNNKSYSRGLQIQLAGNVVHNSEVSLRRELYDVNKTALKTRQDNFIEEHHFTCFSIHNDKIVAPLMRRVIRSIHLNVRKTTAIRRFSCIITTSASNLDIHEGRYKKQNNNFF